MRNVEMHVLARGLRPVDAGLPLRAVIQPHVARRASNELTEQISQNRARYDVALSVTTEPKASCSIPFIFRKHGSQGFDVARTRAKLRRNDRRLSIWRGFEVA